MKESEEKKLRGQLTRTKNEIRGGKLDHVSGGGGGSVDWREGGGERERKREL